MNLKPRIKTEKKIEMIRKATTKYAIMKPYLILRMLICLFRFSFESCDSKTALTDIISKMKVKMNVDVTSWMRMSTPQRPLRYSLLYSSDISQVTLLTIQLIF